MAIFAFTTSLIEEYQRLFDSCHVRPSRANEVNRLVDRISRNRDRYHGVGAPLGIPWYVIGVIHAMEAGLDFKCHLHNGDPLTARTVKEPRNRPAAGQPPFTWEDSATDALRSRKLHQVEDWSLPRTLYRLEGYNGFGYRRDHPEVLSPYLWSFSEHYTSGKYVGDHKFSATTPSDQCGAAVLLRRMAEVGAIEFTPTGAPITGLPDTSARARSFDEFGPLVRFAPGTKSPVVEHLQRMLNTMPGIFVKVDGKAGERTSDAFKKVTGHFLAGDPRAEG